jgi:hypothetical protein
MPGRSASKTRVNALMLPGIHVFLSFYCSKQDADGRGISAFTRVHSLLKALSM